MEEASEGPEGPRANTVRHGARGMTARAIYPPWSADNNGAGYSRLRTDDLDAYQGILLYQLS